jgi:CheY-like chemotaxis protein
MITVLVVDGDPAVGLTIRRVLERAGFAVIAVPDGPTALRRLASLKMDLVICEIEMPGPAGEATIAGSAEPIRRRASSR